MPRSISECIASVAKAGKLTGKAAKQMLEQLEARAERISRETGLAPADAVRQAQTEMKDGLAAAAAIEKRNQLLNLQKRIDRRQRIETTAEALKGDLATAVRNQIVAIATPVKGGRLSAEAAWKSRAERVIGRVLIQLKNEGLFRTVRNGTLEDQWARELYERSLQAAEDPRAQPGVTGSAEAQRVAEIFHDAQEQMRARLNRQGAWIGQYAGFITRTTHDADIIRRAGFEAWRNFIEPRLDPRTFDGIDDRTAFLRSSYDGLATGVHLSDDGGIGYKDPAFNGPGNLAAKLSESRLLHFKDAESWLAYQRRFGTGDLLGQMLHSFDQAARMESILERFGTNPAGELDNDMRYLAERYRGSSPDQVAKLRQAQKSITGLFGMLDGSANRPVNQWAAQLSADARTVESMAKLGMVAFTHLSSAITKAAELRYQGLGFFERYGNFFDSLMQGRGRGEQRDLADLLSAGVEGMHGRLLARFAPDDTVPGTLSKLASHFFDATGLTWLLDAQKAGTARIMSRHLGRLVDADYEHLPPEVRRGLLQYDISAHEWDLLRQAPDHFTDKDGRVFLTPDAADRAADTDIAATWKAKRTGLVLGTDGDARPTLPERDPSEADIRTYRDQLAMKLHAYMKDVADRAIVTPGIADRAILTLGTQPGTVAGEAMRFVSQFKLWGLAAVRQGLGRELTQGRAGAAAGIAQMAAGAALFGYLTMTLKDIFKGQNPRAPNDPKTWMAALIQGGGFGIMGDYLFGEYSRFGGSIGESILGPVLGQGLTEVMNIWNAAKEGRAKDIPPEALRIVMNNLPFVNMFYTRTALNYLFLHSLQERMNPGYLRRSEQNMKRRTGQSYFLSPASTHLHTFGA
jgi:hypothetical protein